MTILRFALKRAFRSPANILLLCAVPAGVVFLPAVGGQGWSLPIGFHIYGMVIMSVAFLMVRSIVEDRFSGALARISAAPVSYLRYLSENLLAYGLLLLIQNALVVGLGVLVHGSRIPSPFLLLAAYFFFSMTSISFALAWCSLFGRRDVAYGTFFSVIMIASMLGGFYWPIEIMPGIMRKMAPAVPPYWMMEAARTLQAGGPPSRFALSLAVMLLFTVAFLLVGSRRRME
jgi:ABC-2 type transport system permease protein